VTTNLNTFSLVSMQKITRKYKSMQSCMHVQTLIMLPSHASLSWLTHLYLQTWKRRKKLYAFHQCRWRCFSEFWWNSATCFRVELRQTGKIKMCPWTDKQTSQKETGIEKEETGRAPRSRNSERASWHALLALQNQGPWPQLQECCGTMLHAISLPFVFVRLIPAM
jgi:hypothetical protein